MRGCGESERYISHPPGKYFLFVRLSYKVTYPHDEQESEPLNKLNLVTVLSRKRTNHTGSIHWPNHSFFFGLALAVISARTWIVRWFRRSTSLWLLLRLRTWTRTRSRRWIPSARRRDWFVKWSWTLSVYLYGIHVDPVVGRLGLGNELELTHWILRWLGTWEWVRVDALVPPMLLQLGFDWAPLYPPRHP